LTIKVENKTDMVQQLRETFHDMRQPVAIMMALAAAALTEPDLPAAAQLRLEQIVGQAEWLSDIIRNCLPKQQQQQQQREEPCETGKPGRDSADMVQIVGEAIEAERLTWPGDMKLVAPAGPVQCRVDPVLLRRAVSNVLGNAVRAAGLGGTVSVEIQRCDDAIMVAVEDSGPGFGEIPSGAGLGLTAVARNITKYGGRIEYSCGVHGSGARVSLWFP
jgi:two-component system sensor histidine kinase QseC